MLSVVIRASCARRTVLLVASVSALLASSASAAGAAVSWETLDTPLTRSGIQPPDVAVTPGGETIVVTPDATGMTILVRAFDGTTATQHIAGADPLTGTLETDGSSGAYLAWSDSQGDKVAYRPAGGTFGAADLVIPSGSGPLSLAVAPNGTAVLLGLVPSGLGHSGFTATVARRTSGSWGSPVAISDPGEASSIPSPVAAIASDGSAMALWDGTDAGAFRHVTVRRITAAGALGTPQLDLLESTNLPSPDLAMNLSGEAIVAGAYHGDIGYRTAAADSPFGVFHILTAPGESAQTVDVAAGPDGRAALALDVNEPAPSNSRVAKDVEVTVGPIASPLPALAAVSGGPGAHPQVAFDATGRALVTYNDLTGPSAFNDGRLWATSAAPQETFAAAAPIRCAPPFTVALGASAGGGRFVVLSAAGGERPGPTALSLSYGTTFPEATTICPPMLYGVTGPEIVGSAGRSASYDAASMQFGTDDHVSFSWAVYEYPLGPSPLTAGYLPHYVRQSLLGFEFPHAGRFRVVATAFHTNATTWNDRRSLDVIVNPAPTIALVTDPSGTATVGAPVSVSATAAATAPATLTSTTVVVPAGGVVTSETSGRKTVVFSKPGTYTFLASATDSYGLTTTASKDLAVVVAAPPAPTTPRVACANVRFPKTAKVDKRRKVVTLRATSRAAGCRATIVLMRTNGGRAGAKTVVLGAAGTTTTVRVRLNSRAVAWLRRSRRGRLIGTVTTPTGATSGKVTVRI